MLTDKACRAAATDDSPIKLSDGQGLYLFVTKTGLKSWRLKYRFGGKEKKLVFGPFPAIGLREARDKRDEARKQLRDGIDPSLSTRRAKARAALGGDSFREAALRWHELQKPGWKEKHAADAKGSLEKHVFPSIGSIPLLDVRPADVRHLLEKVQAESGSETAHRLRGRISGVYQLAIASELAEIDPAASTKAILRPIVHKMRPAFLRIEDCRLFLKRLEAEPMHPSTKLMSRLLALTAARPGMVRWAEPPEFEDLDGKTPTWRVPAEKMKLTRNLAEQEAFAFMVPLSRQAAETVRLALQLAGKRKYLFPSHWHSHKPVSENALVDAYRRLPGNRGKHVPHGWRASFATIMNERATDGGRADDRAVIDLMLAHQPGGVEARYNRAAFMPRRRELAQEWADLLLNGMPAAESLLEGLRR